MKKMGNYANVEIEPDSQSALLDQCKILPGVLFAGIPGGILQLMLAGGYDAIFSVTLGLKSRKILFSHWESLNGRVAPLLCSRGDVGILIESNSSLFKKCIY
jgi:phosphomevalonate kinase